MSMGISASVVSGWLIDRVGLEICTGLTLVMGQVQMLFLGFFSDNQSLVVASFWIYAFFRQFLYPVFISSLTSHLGFKYFGILLGVGFFAGGLAQLFLATLVEAVQGDCREQKQEAQGDCNHGFWKQLHIIQFVVLGVLMIVPLQDRRDRLEQERLMKTVLSIGYPPTPGYGALA
jgi:MFS family permease